MYFVIPTTQGSNYRDQATTAWSITTERGPGANTNNTLVIGKKKLALLESSKEEDKEEGQEEKYGKQLEGQQQQEQEEQQLPQQRHPKQQQQHQQQQQKQQKRQQQNHPGIKEPMTDSSEITIGTAEVDRSSKEAEQEEGQEGKDGQQLEELQKQQQKQQQQQQQNHPEVKEHITDSFEIEIAGDEIEGGQSSPTSTVKPTESGKESGDATAATLKLKETQEEEEEDTFVTRRTNSGFFSGQPDIGSTSPVITPRTEEGKEKAYRPFQYNVDLEGVEEEEIKVKAEEFSMYS